jgi:hypothetical protein
MAILARTSATTPAGPDSTRNSQHCYQRGQYPRGQYPRGQYPRGQYPRGPSGVPFVGALLLGLLLMLLPSLARAQEPLRILVLEGATPDWVRRVRGQLSDLPVSISTLALVVEGQPEPQLARQLGPLAEHRDAALVAWLMTERLDSRAAQPSGAAALTGSTRVAIWFARTGRFFSRPLGGPWSRLSASDRSGVLELGALSVRSAVRSLLLDPAQAEPFRDVEPARTAAGAAAAGPNAGSSNAGSSGAAPGTPAARTGAPSSGAASSASASRAASSAPTPNPGPPNAMASGAVPPSAVPSAAPPSASSAAPPSASSAAPSTAATPDASRAGGSAEAAARAVAAASASGGSAPHDTAQPQDGPIVATRGAATVPTDQASDEAAAESFALDLHWNAELGVIGQLPGPPAYGAAGFEAGLRARTAGWGVLLLGQLGLPVRAKLGPSEVQVQQHALLVEGQYLGWNTGAWSFGPVLRAGLRLARRETVGGDPGLDASEVKWLPGLRLGLGWATELRWSQHFGATLRGVLHWDPVRPSYAVLNEEREPVSSAQLWAVQPSLELCANWYW